MNIGAANIGLHYSDVFIKQAIGRCNSRDDISTRLNFLGHRLAGPVIPANMKSVVDFSLAEVWAKNGYFYIMHRFYDYSLIKEFCKHMNAINLATNISVGVQSKDYDFLEELRKDNVTISSITVDIAHGWNDNMFQMLGYLRDNHADSLIIAGNVMGAEACKDLHKAGADIVKVGLSMGKACTTYNITGIGSPMFTTVLECAKTGIPIIADGQVREYGDICKALFAGAKMVMVGSLFAACSDSPAKCDLHGRKIYQGSASLGVGGERYVEGSDYIELPMSNSSLFVFRKMQEAIRSFLSYRGVDNLEELTYDETGWGVLQTPKHLLS